MAEELPGQSDDPAPGKSASDSQQEGQSGQTLWPARRFRASRGLRIGNAVVATLTRWGLVPHTYILTTKGRKTGRLHTTPVTEDCPSRTLIRIDPIAGAVAASIPLSFAALADESSVAAGEGGVYVMSGGAITPTIARVDPTTNAMSSTFPAPDGSKALRAGLGGLWVSSPTRGTVSRLDSATGATVATVKISSGGENFLTVGYGSVWVLNNNTGTVARIDPSTNTVTTRIQATKHSHRGRRHRRWRRICVGQGRRRARRKDRSDNQHGHCPVRSAIRQWKRCRQ